MYKRQALGSQPKKVSNLLMVETMRLLKEKEMEPEDIRFSPEHLSRLIALVDGKVINSSVAKEVFQVMFEEDVDPEQYVEEKGLKTVNDEGALRKVVELSLIHILDRQRRLSIRVVPRIR